MKSWPEQIRDITRHLHDAYSPGDDSPSLGRCDLLLVIEACHEAQSTLLANPCSEGQLTMADLLEGIQSVLQGMSGDLRDLAESTKEVSSALMQLRAPHL